jgi:steroid 5-alpha reductase family enzyme
MISLAAAIAAQSQGHSLFEVPAGALVALLILFWLPVLGWELARKIRSREEEDAYVTYSRIFGAAPASLVTLTVQSVPFFIGAYWALTLPLSPVFVVLWVAAYAVVVRGHVRFLLRPSPATARLRPIAELYTLLLLFAVVGGHVAAQIWR